MHDVIPKIIPESGKFLGIRRLRHGIGMGVEEGTYGMYAYVPDVGLRIMSFKFYHAKKLNILKF